MSTKSMTGFARVARPLARGQVTISLKSVNHRGLDLHFHMPPSLDGFESHARTVIRRRISRGHIQIQVLLEEGGANGAGALNGELLERWVAAYREAARMIGSSQNPDPNAALRVPGMLQSGSALQWSEDLESELLGHFEEALEILDGFREREGAAIEAELLDRSRRIRELA